VSIRLIGVTQPLGIDGMTTAEQLLAYCARVSNTANQGNHETGPRLIKSLVRRQEWSPLEMVSVLIEIETTRDVARQILRHRSLSFQEFSQRYAAVENQAVYREARDQDPDDRQGSLPINNPSAQQDWLRAQERVWATAMAAYSAALSRGMAKEVARTVLPEGMTRSLLYSNGTLRSWLHYVMLRTQRGTQKEHREIAADILEALVVQFPSLKALL